MQAVKPTCYLIQLCVFNVLHTIYTFQVLCMKIPQAISRTTVTDWTKKACLCSFWWIFHAYSKFKYNILHFWQFSEILTKKWRCRMHLTSQPLGSRELNWHSSRTLTSYTDMQIMWFNLTPGRQASYVFRAGKPASYTGSQQIEHYASLCALHRTEWGYLATLSCSDRFNVDAYVVCMHYP